MAGDAYEDRRRRGRFECIHAGSFDDAIINEDGDPME
jgi:hypothetical protein